MTSGKLGIGSQVEAQTRPRLIGWCADQEGVPTRFELEALDQALGRGDRRVHEGIIKIRRGLGRDRARRQYDDVGGAPWARMTVGFHDVRVKQRGTVK